MMIEKMIKGCYWWVTS